MMVRGWAENKEKMTPEMDEPRIISDTPIQLSLFSPGDAEIGKFDTVNLKRK